jgi:23S rRNA pseudouridine955/2504/2580 synthase
MDQRILYEDGSLLVIDKPAGMAVHGGSGLSWGVIEAFRMLRNENYLELVHRLDRETSGCLLIARRRSALRALHEQLRDNQMKKCYLALLCGRLSKDKVTVTAALRKNVLQSGERMVRVDKDGKTARTEFRVARRFSNWTLVEARPVTGRTHQIRVHAAYIGHPIVGDGKYGDDEANRQARGMGLSRLFLHAAELGFFLPGESKRISVRSPLDRALSDYLARLV